MKRLAPAWLSALVLLGCVVASELPRAEALYPNSGLTPVDITSLVGRTLVGISMTPGGWPIPTELSSPTRLRIDFPQSGGLRFTGGCDTLTAKGPIGITGKVYLDVGSIESTAISPCEPDMPRQDRWLRDLLESKALVMIEGSNVRFSGAGGMVWMTDGAWERP